MMLLIFCHYFSICKVTSYAQLIGINEPLMVYDCNVLKMKYDDDLWWLMCWWIMMMKYDDDYDNLCDNNMI
jgi:hypothetical protein